MTQVRLVVRCEREYDHAKILVMNGVWDEELTEEELVRRAQAVGEILDGTSGAYIFSPEGRSPIGFCGLCRSKLKSRVERVEVRE